MPQNYELFLVPLLFDEFGKDLADQVDCPERGAVLETACGTGAVTRHLRERLPSGARLTATDVAPAMIDMARISIGENGSVTYRQADATELPFDDATFDAVVCQFSVMFFPSLEDGFAEAKRVLVPGGWYHFNVWDRLGENQFSQAVHEAMSEIYPDDAPDFLKKPYACHDMSRIEESLRAAGFDQIEIEPQRRTSTAPTAGDVVQGLVAGSPLAGQIAERDLSPAQVIERATRILEDRFGAGPVEAPMQAFRVSARRPK